jgi:hypothetical protein
MAAAVTFPLGFDYRASIVDRSNLFGPTIATGAPLVPRVYGAVPLVGDENRTVVSVDAVNFGSRTNDVFGVPMDLALGGKRYGHKFTEEARKNAGK